MSRAFAASGKFEERLVHTGQHYDDQMSAAFFRELDLPAAAINLGIANLPHGAMTGRMVEGIEADLMAARPDAVVVYGDTNSTLAGALAAAKLGIPAIHVEAGMRSGRKDVPEEINRIVADHVCGLLLCSSQAAICHLRKEGLAENARLIGDLMYDVTLFAKDRVSASSVMSRLGVQAGSYSLLTLHRAENMGDPVRLARLIDYAREAGRGYPIVFPVHPRTDAFLKAEGISLGGILPIEPLGYFDFHALIGGCIQVMTDSGGVQKEAYFHARPCITLRDETEWIETIEAGWNRLWTQPTYEMPRRAISDYGTGEAAKAAVSAIANYLSA